jgi:MEKHLA domain
MADPVPALFQTPATRERIALIAASFERLLGRPLVAPSGDLVAALWNAPLAVVAHGTESDPLFFFASRAALAAFAARLDQFIGMPSRLSAEAIDRAGRQALLDRVSARGFIDDYAGMRVKLTGEHFRIEAATVWNLIDAAGVRHGQAAAFAVPDK